MQQPSAPAGKTGIDLISLKHAMMSATALRWIRIASRALLAWLVAVIAGALLNRFLEDFIDVWFPFARWLLFGVIPVLALFGFGVRASKTLNGPSMPALSSIIQARRQAAGSHGAYFGALIFVLAFAVEIAVSMLLASVIDLSDAVATAWVLTALVLPILLGLWGTFAMEAQTYNVLSHTGTLLPTIDLQARARALEEAMREANAIAEDLRLETEHQQQLLAELYKKAKDTELAASISQTKAEALARIAYAKQEQDYRRSIRVGLLTNLVVGLIFYALGVLTPPDALDHLAQWLHRL
jgi:hypothetical protein